MAYFIHGGSIQKNKEDISAFHTYEYLNYKYTSPFIPNNFKYISQSKYYNPTIWKPLQNGSSLLSFNKLSTEQNNKQRCDLSTSPCLESNLCPWVASQTIYDWMNENCFGGITFYIPESDETVLVSNEYGREFFNYQWNAPNYLNYQNPLVYMETAPEPGGGFKERGCHLFDWINLYYGGDLGLKHRDGWENYSLCDTIAIREYTKVYHTCSTNNCASSKLRYTVYLLNRETQELEDITNLVLESDTEQLESTGFNCSGPFDPCGQQNPPEYLEPPLLYFAPCPTPSPSP
jgi:hypothetical protein